MVKTVDKSKMQELVQSDETGWKEPKSDTYAKEGKLSDGSDYATVYDSQNERLLAQTAVNLGNMGTSAARFIDLGANLILDEGDIVRLSLKGAENPLLDGTPGNDLPNQFYAFRIVGGKLVLEPNQIINQEQKKGDVDYLESAANTMSVADLSAKFLQVVEEAGVPVEESAVDDPDAPADEGDID